jgi:hypothetical protein
MNQYNIRLISRTGVTMISRTLAVVASILCISMLGVAGCSKQDATTSNATSALAPPAAPPPMASPFKITASIAELMDSVIDPSADSLWDAVGTTVTAKGTVQHAPRTDEEWKQARRHAIALIEGTNLLVMDGRKLVAPGAPVLDQDVQGVLSPEEGQKKLDADHTAFVQFAYALHDVGEQMLKAIDAKNAEGMMTAGATMDGVCEACHLTFWYPNQVIPELPASLDADKLLHQKGKHSGLVTPPH